MAKAIILITSDPGKDREVAGKVKEIEGVENVYLFVGINGQLVFRFIIAGQFFIQP